MARVALTTLMLLAATMQGEAEVLSDEAALAVFEVAMNRVWHPSFPNDLEAVLRQGFNGWRGIETWEEIEVKYIGLACRAMVGGHGWMHPALYMLSWPDLMALGGVNHPPLKVYRNGDWAVYLYERWPR